MADDGIGNMLFHKCESVTSKKLFQGFCKSLVYS